MNSILEAVTALTSARTLDDVTTIVRSSARALTNADGVTFVLREDRTALQALANAAALAVRNVQLNGELVLAIEREREVRVLSRALTDGSPADEPAGC